MRSLVLGLMLCLSSVHAQEANPRTPKEQYEALLKEYEAADEAWNKRFDAGAGDEAKVDWVARSRDWPGWSFAPRFLKVAEVNPDDPVAIDSLIWVISRAMNVGVGDRRLYPHYRRALELLARGDHL